MRSKSTFIQERGGKDVVNMAEAECHVAVPAVPDPQAAREYSDEEIAQWMDNCIGRGGLRLHTPRRMATAKGQEIWRWQRW